MARPLDRLAHRHPRRPADRAARHGHRARRALAGGRPARGVRPRPRHPRASGRRSRSAVRRRRGGARGVLADGRPRARVVTGPMTERDRRPAAPRRPPIGRRGVACGSASTSAAARSRSSSSTARARLCARHWSRPLVRPRAGAQGRSRRSIDATVERRRRDARRRRHDRDRRPRPGRPADGHGDPRGQPRLERPAAARRTRGGARRRASSRTTSVPPRSASSAGAVRRRSTTSPTSRRDRDLGRRRPRRPAPSRGPRSRRRDRPRRRRPDGPVCACGLRGCLETHVAGPAIARPAREAVAAGRPTTLASTPDPPPTTCLPRRPRAIPSRRDRRANWSVACPGRPPARDRLRRRPCRHRRWRGSRRRRLPASDPGRTGARMRVLAVRRRAARGTVVRLLPRDSTPVHGARCAGRQRGRLAP